MNKNTGELNASKVFIFFKKIHYCSPLNYIFTLIQSFGYTVKLGYNEHARYQQLLFVTTIIHYNNYNWNLYTKVAIRGKRLQF